ncbi:HEAT repeat domain-containing protein [uncultured Flavonifractor sp.]|uniref:HEAT repeat domain-containing protein n=1 Tax=uncultured Flavonifractor sp. TaxID=1193534 RepID=UPI00260DEA37|nr:HEAT repeat domain-containing protein [uncultured Flavonifractor sp.]
MRIEVMIYIYGAICLSMILFNVVYSLLLRGSKPRLDRRSRKLEGMVQLQLERLRRGEHVEEGHQIRMQRKLRHLKNLMAFDQTLRPLVQEEKDSAIHSYLVELQPTILYLALVYIRRENMQAAYFSYFLSRYMLKRHMPIQTLQDVMLDYARKDNLYCRVNALQALYNFGSPQHICTALQMQTQSSVFLHEKILTEGLLSYTGDHSQLIALLWERLDTFPPHTQLAILNYIRFQTGDYTAQMLELMTNQRADKELRLAAIRYFGKYHYQPALDYLLYFSSQTDPTRWEYATVSVTALACYRGERVVIALKQALHSANWYVRYAAAASLEAQQMDYKQLLDIVSGSDRYAREMMTYRLESRRMQKAGG